MEIGLRLKSQLVQRARWAICLLLIVAGLAHTGTKTPAAVDARPVGDASTARLAGLARVWGAAKFFHPRLASSGIDWDGALVKVIPAVSASRNAEDYAAAVNTMLSTLGDPATVARVAKPERQSGSTGNERGARVRVASGILTVDLGDTAHLGESPAALAAMAAQFLPQAKAVLLDLRSNAEAGTDMGQEVLLPEILPVLLDQDLPTATVFYRIHVGYPPQHGSTTGGYYSATQTQAPTGISSRAKSKTPPILVLVNSQSAAIPLVIGLQSAGLAYVVQEGASPAAESAMTLDLGMGVEAVVTTSQWLDSRGRRGFAPDRIVAPGQAEATARTILSLPNFPHSRPARQEPLALADGKDDSYPQMLYPRMEYRLLALFRYWNVINYFFPYKALIGADWNDVLPEYIPRMEASADADEYETTLRALSVEIHDSHGFMGPTKAFARRVGEFTAPVALRNIQGQSVVAAVLDAKAPLHVGDVIVSIDGRPLSQRRGYFLAHYPASRPEAALQAVQPFLLRGQKGSVARLGVKALNGSVRQVQVDRTMSAYSPALRTALARKSPEVAILPGAVGYVDLARLRNDEVDDMFDTIKSTKATIFDMRGYPNGTAWTVAPRLSGTRNPVAALFSLSVVDGSVQGADAGVTLDYQYRQRLPDPGGDRYSGKVVMLIDESTASQAEHTCLFFEAATDVTFVGTTTAGADGDVTNLVLPGGITASFSGQSVRHADGRQLQQVGIQPTIHVAPTIAGVAAGRDEVLEAAVEFLGK